MTQRPAPPSPASGPPAANFDPQPVTLRGEHVVLEPLALAHADELLEAGHDAAVWRYLPIAQPRTTAEMRAWIEQGLEQASAGLALPFTIRERAGAGADASAGASAGRAIGSTRFLDIRRADRGLEIGWTWLGVLWQRSAVNTECKLLLLRHAFSALGAVRVQLKTDLRNLASQRAIERLGAVREGVLRRSLRLWDGHVRDSVYYAILDDEWPGVEQRLVRLLQRA